MLQKTRNTYKKAKKLLTQVAMQLIEEQPIHYCNNIIQTIQEAKQKSIEYNKPSFIKITFFEHSFLLSLFDNKVCLIDSLNSQTGSIFKMLLKIINKKEKLDLTIININTDQQTDFNSCPYFTGFNITRLDKWFQTNFKNFDKLFKKKYLPLSIINSIQSIQKIQKKFNIGVNTETNKDELEKKLKYKTKLEEQQIKKILKHIEYDRIENKLKNLRVYNKSQKVLEKFIEINTDIF